jgi:hypothetical protein
MYKATFIALLSVLSIGCAGVNSQLPMRYIDEPDNFKCPSEYFAYCEGHNRSQMECQCIDRQYQRNTIQSIFGIV